MATANPFDLLGDDDNGDPASLLNIAIKPKPTAKNKQSVPAAKLPTRPLPPAEAVRLGRSTQRGGGRGGQGFANREQDSGYGRGRGGSYNGDRSFTRGNYGSDYPAPLGDDSLSARREDGEAVPGGRGRGGRGGRDARPEETGRRAYERRSGTGRGTEMKREGAGRGNWGTPVDQGSFQEVEELLSVEDEKIATSEKHSENEDKQETPVVDTEKKKEEEDKEMTLDEYEKLLEERRRTIMVTKLQERKVDAKQFESMQQLTNKKNDDEYMLVKVTSEDKLKKIEAGERDEKIRKAMSINEFLKPAEGERYYGRGRGRGRGRGDRGGFKGGFDSAANPHQLEALSIEDPGQFPSLGGK